MMKAIKVLEKRIDALNNELSKVEKEIEEPEMTCDYEFSLNAAYNIELEIIELTEAIKILNQNIQ